MIVGDVKAVFVFVTVPDDTGFEVVAAGWGDCRAGCNGGKGGRSSSGQRSSEEGGNSGD